jgi:CBS domain-containing protein
MASHDDVASPAGRAQGSRPDRRASRGQKEGAAMTTTVRRMLDHKRDIFWTTPDASVFDALRLMAKHNVGALLVLEDGELAGIFSERDYARKVILLGRTSRETAVRDIMTREVIYVEPNQTAEECMAIMTNHHIRHLPVMERGRLVGVISIGDVVREVIAEQQDTITHLVGYIGMGS